MKRVTIIGAGNSGLAMAAHLALTGNRVRVWNRTPARIAELAKSLIIEVDGVIEGTAGIELATSSMREAIRGAELILVTTPATGHRDIARLLAPHLERDVTIILNPGRTFGALEFQQLLWRYGCRVMPRIAETQTIIYACRKTGPCSVRVYALKHEVSIATLNPEDVYAVLTDTPDCLRERLRPADSIIQTSLGNIGMILHCLPVLLNAGWIEATQGGFAYYQEGITPSVGRILEKLDLERMAVASALGYPVESAREWFRRSYGVGGASLHECIQGNRAYDAIQAPGSLLHRYLLEDVPTGLVPLEAVGKALGLPMRLTGLVIDLASELLGTDLRREGRNLHRLGLAGMTPDEIMQLFGGTWEECPAS